ncbi:alpha/beta hydrolase family protein [Actinomadura sp. SCN-SB]|uniref:alpha/beta hydrolase family protein n=1 Tax=Actinomadura sp. SCN-SB TaxID=3373092 RepID=UPI003752D5F1
MTAIDLPDGPAHWPVGRPAAVERVEGSAVPVRYYLAETLDGLYTPYALRTPPGPGPHPFVFLAYGNGGGGLEWLRDRVHNYAYITERLLEAGYACAWARYRAEVELGYHRGGPLVRDRRQGMDLFNRSPLEFEDELAILQHVRALPDIDAARIAHVGVSHAGEMLFKLASAFPDAVVCGVACEPANHEFLDLSTDHTVTVNPDTAMRDIEEMQMRSPAAVRKRVNERLALERIAPITIPILVMGRDDDHLQGIFRVSYDLLAESGKPAEWVSWDHDLHGYIFPHGTSVDPVQERAITGVIDFLGRHLQEGDA